VLPVDIDPKNLVPDYISDFILQREELVLGVVRYQEQSGSFYVIGAMPLPDQWEEGINIAPLSVFYRDTPDYYSLSGAKDFVPQELFHTLLGIAYALTMQGVEVYTHQFTDSKTHRDIESLTNPLASHPLHNEIIKIPGVRLFRPGKPPEKVVILQAAEYKTLRSVSLIHARKWLVANSAIKEAIKKAIDKSSDEGMVFNG